MSNFIELKTKLQTTITDIQQRWATFQQEHPLVVQRAKIAGRVGKWMAIAGVTGVILLFLAVRFGVFGALPDYTALRKIQNPIASEVYSADGVLLGRYFKQNRTNTAFRNIPKHLIDALVATEDARFYDHSGVDIWSLFRVFFKSILFQNNSSGGGSTISQQLAKNLYGRKRYGMITMPVNKIREMIIATRLEHIYNKEEILELYLNTVSFGEDVFGIETASKRFFNKKPKDLKIEDAAVLVGMLKATTFYNPKNNPDYATSRRNTVFHQMKVEEYLAESTADSLQALPLKIDYKYVSQSDGLAPHLRERLRLELEEWCKTQTKTDGTPYNLYTDGLKIYTTVNAKMQQYAQDAVQQHLSTLQKTFFAHWKNRKPWGKNDKQIQWAKKQSKRYQRLKAQGWSEAEIDKNFNTPVLMRVFTWKGEEEKEMTPMDSIAYYQMFLNTGFVVTEPKTGYIRAYVGSINHKYFQYDHAMAKRQVGSTFKPIVYAAAIENGHRPCDYVPNQLVTFTEYQNWRPENSDGKYGGFYSLEGGLKNSVNTVSVDLTLFSGVENVIDFAHQMGVQSEIQNYPSIALGAVDIPLYEMVQVYSTFANYGKRVQPSYLLRVENKKGDLLKTWEVENVAYQTEEEEPFMSEGTAETMIKIMQTVVDSGTAKRLRFRYGLTQPIAGKTGTTQNHADGWFMGFTSNLVGGVWVGGANRHIRFRDLANGQGANMALPIWGIFMQKVVKDKSFNTIRNSFFRSPADSVQLMLDCPYYVDEILPYDIEEYLSPEELEERIRINEKPDEDLTDMDVEREEELDAKADEKRTKAKRKARKKKKRKEFWNKVKKIFKK